MRVLLCDDDITILQTIGEYLEIRNVGVDYCSRGQEAVQLASQDGFDVIVLDVKMPGASGLDACQKMRAAGIITPILFLTARDSLDDVLAGFEAGGDDYLIKPFAFEELYARICALSTRLSRQGSATMSVGDLRIDLRTNEVKRGNMTLHLNPMQFKLLKCLASKSPGVVTKSKLARAIWQDDAPESDALRTHIFNLRRIIDKPFDSQYLRTVHGIGFRLCSDDGVEENRETL